MMIVMLLAVFAVGPAASADARRGHGHHHGRHIQHFIILSSDPDENATSVVVAKGRIHAKGTDTQVSETMDTFTFPRGSLSITHKPKKEGKFRQDQVTCHFVYTERGTYKVKSGTGAYARAHGHGRYSLRATGVGCSETDPPEVFLLEVHAHGPLHY